MAETELWAKVALFGHVELAGRITKPGEYGGLWQLDIPEGETFRTEFFSNASIFRIQLVSEAIARAYASAIGNSIIEYNAPIITREEHLQRMEMAQDLLRKVERENETLRRRLTAVEQYAPPLPPGEEEDDIPL